MTPFRDQASLERHARTPEGRESIKQYMARARVNLATQVATRDAAAAEIEAINGRLTMCANAMAATSAVRDV